MSAGTLMIAVCTQEVRSDRCDRDCTEVRYVKTVTN